MKPTFLGVLLGSILVLFLATVAAAWDNDQAAIALHIAPARWNTLEPCSMTPGLSHGTVDYQTPALSAPVVGPFFWTYLIVCNASYTTGIAGVECGIDYPGGYNPSGNPTFPICVLGWHRCGDLEFPFGNWPAPRSNNIVTWSQPHCQKTKTGPGNYSVIAVAGYFYMAAYQPAQMSVIPRPVSGFAKVADCRAGETNITGLIPSHLGVAGFGGAPGYNPCGAPTAIEGSTWGGVKSLQDR